MRTRTIRTTRSDEEFTDFDIERAQFIQSMVRAISALHMCKTGASFDESSMYLALGFDQRAAVAGKAKRKAKVICTASECISPRRLSGQRSTRKRLMSR